MSFMEGIESTLSCIYLQSDAEYWRKNPEETSKKKIIEVIMSYFHAKILSLRLCESDPGTPLLSFPVVVLSQEQMAKPTSPALLSWKRSTFFPAFPLPLKCTPMRSVYLYPPKTQRELPPSGHSLEARRHQKALGTQEWPLGYFPSMVLGKKD